MEDFILLFTGCIGLATTLILLVFYRTNKMINLYLITILSYVSIFALLKSSYALGIQTFANEKFFGYKRLSVFTFPLLFLFFKEILGSCQKNSAMNWVHFILPFLFFLSFEGLLYFDSLSDGIIACYYFVYFLLNFAYLVACLDLFKSYLNKLSLKKIISDIGYQKEKWILFIFCIWTLLCLRILILIIIDLINGKLSGFDKGIGLWSVLIIAAFIKLLVSPELLYGFNALEKRMKTTQLEIKKTVLLKIWKLDNNLQLRNRQDKLLAPKVSENLLDTILEIERIVLNEQIFRNPDFDLTMLSKKLNIPKSHLTFIFKYYSTHFFLDFKKMLQIMDAEKLIENGYLAENTLDSLSLEVGFSSYSPFFSAFKKYTGYSPNNYIHKNTFLKT
ncbi:helix-turn-helix domain-containing protein [Maribacter sp. X9]|uniref:AraC family transcriptional regulator n=1 Tax=Maribacter sp. X9 TaxID=3402159 RepID=UPI003AF409B5